MNRLRIGTRGSDLARRQTEWVCRRLKEAHDSLSLDPIVIETHGDLAAEQTFGPGAPVGVFVGALEAALSDGRIDLAVHSLKDLQTEPTKGLIVAAIPTREAAHDVLLTRERLALRDLPPGARVGTSSPRRAAQMRREFDVEIVPLRGNVPTRITKMGREGLDGIVLAAAGLNRLGIVHPHVIALPVERFVPAPGQGALAIQGREGSTAVGLAAVLDDPLTRRAVSAERQFLHNLGAGCHTPAGAYATATAATVTLLGQLFSEDGVRCVTGTEEGRDPVGVGVNLADRLRRQLAE